MHFSIDSITMLFYDGYMRAERENKWNRKPSANQSATEQAFWRMVAEDEGDQERAEKTLGTKLDAGKVEAAEAALFAVWTPEVFAERRARWNASFTANPNINIPVREKQLGFSYNELMIARRKYVKG